MEQSPQKEAHIPSVCEGITTPSHGFYETRKFAILSTLLDSFLCRLNPVQSLNMTYSRSILIDSCRLRLDFQASRLPFKYYISNSVWYLIFPVRSKCPVLKRLRFIHLILFCYYKLLCILLILNVFHFWPRQVLLRRTYLKVWTREYEQRAHRLNTATSFLIKP